MDFYSFEQRIPPASLEEGFASLSTLFMDSACSKALLIKELFYFFSFFLERDQFFLSADLIESFQSLLEKRGFSQELQSFLLFLLDAKFSSYLSFFFLKQFQVEKYVARMETVLFASLQEEGKEDFQLLKDALLHSGFLEQHPLLRQVHASVSL